MTLFESAELALRSGGVTTAGLLLVIVALRAGWRKHLALLAVLACLASYLVCSSPARSCVREVVHFPFLIGAIAFPFAFWHLASFILDDDRAVPVLAWVGLSALLVSGAFAAADYLGLPIAARDLLGAAHKGVTFAFVLSALARAWRSWADDLVEQRRRLRWLLVGYIGLYSLSVALVEVSLQGAVAPAWLDVLNVVLIDLSLVCTVLYLVGLRAHAMEVLFGVVAAPAVHVEPAQGEPPYPQGDTALAERLTALMHNEALYRDAELSVARLAEAMAVPEYVLRRLIHTRLGHRNFPAFVNDYRLREVVERMADPALERRPILTLALEAGFGSIGPFNRLFRARYGITPSEFRARGAARAA